MRCGRLQLRIPSGLGEDTTDAFRLEMHLCSIETAERGAGAHPMRWSLGLASWGSASAHSGTRVNSSARPSSPARRGTSANLAVSNIWTSDAVRWGVETAAPACKLFTAAC